jgi:transcriptional regulator of PTS gene
MPTEQIRKRILNGRALLLALHFNGPLQRKEISRRCGIRPNSVSGLVAEMLDTGFVREEEPGRPRSRIALDGTRQSALVASLHAEEIDVGRVFLDGRIEDRRAVPLKDSRPAAVVETLARAIRGLSKSDKATLGVGIATPGLVNARKGAVLYAANLREWRNVMLADDLQKQIQIPVSVRNDVQCQLYGQAWFGRIRPGAREILYLHVGEGVACSVMTRGRLVEGRRFSAGEIGHVRAGEEGRLCKCGKADCLEAYGSVPALASELELLKASSPIEPTAQNLAQAAVQHPQVVNIIDRAAQRILTALTPLAAALDPYMILVGSDDQEFSKLLCRLLEPRLRAELLGLGSRAARLDIAEPSREAALKGAAAEVIQRAFRNGAFLKRAKKRG